MEEQKNELVKIIQSIKTPGLIDYFLTFVKLFIVKFCGGLEDGKENCND